MLIGSLIASLINDPSNAVGAMIEGSHSAVTLSLNLLALYAFWLGLFSIIEKLGISQWLDRLLAPVINKLFPKANQQARKYITMNISANLLGLGNAATPMAINAIGALDNGDKKASENMIMLTVISATSLQLLPTTVIGMRASHGSANPADFLLASVIATVVSTFLGILLVKIFARIFRKIDGKKAARANKVDNAVNQTATKTAYKTDKISKAKAPHKIKAAKHLYSPLDKRKAIDFSGRVKR